MIVETTSEDYASLLRGSAPRGLTLVDTPIALLPVMQMLTEVAARIRPIFEPVSWLIVDDEEFVGLCSITRPPNGGVVNLGYGIAPSRQGRGLAGKAIADIVAWARQAPGVIALTAETSTSNKPSQRVLSRNGFAQVGERIDEEDGPLICWRCTTA